ncbi:alpha/beta hydrolase [Paenarthrobacter sp. Z7-10]|uniref:alpha/beta fold hydrolase n=1 Tax=Paenarthrobacter sp. Z7-10 TaxID=2787635 RepID=UPI0022A94EB5|nr:alpha/beta hydrolase [Paenarthrobacter sp. Z7-10]MCZ2403885.1 alpha/beta hydrolase [Paenarthrobacter sp. Z7-10]
MHKERIVFVHGAGGFGAAAWPKQHGLALAYDALFLKRHGFDAEAEPLPTDFDADRDIVLDALGSGGHVVAHSQGAISAMMAAVDRPDLVHSLVLVEPACLSLTAELPATAAHRGLMDPLFARRFELTDDQFHREFVRIASSSEAQPLLTEEERRAARRLRLQTPPWEAPLHFVPGVPTLVLTGGWEPLYEEIAGYLASTGAAHRSTAGAHRPHDTADGDRLIRAFLRDQPGR